jgi:hypothetical protein
MAQGPTNVGDVLDAFRQFLGGAEQRVALPSWLLDLGARLGDVICLFGWEPPIRSTTLAEMRRGVAGDHRTWAMATGIEPASLESTVRALPDSVQEKWFARLYLIKALVLTTLAVFWTYSGLITLSVAFDPAVDILTSHSIALPFAKMITIVTGLADIAVGGAIAFRRSCRTGLVVGVGLSLFYMVAATILTPELWLEPLGALVKIVPAIATMVVALAILENR